MYGVLSAHESFCSVRRKSSYYFLVSIPLVFTLIFKFTFITLFFDSQNVYVINFSYNKKITGSQLPAKTLFPLYFRKLSKVSILIHFL